MPKGATARLVAGINERVTQATQAKQAAEQAVVDVKQRHQKELAGANEQITKSSLSLHEVRRTAFEELLHHHEMEQCSLCLQEVPAPKVKLICKVDPQSFTYNSPQNKLPDWSRDARLLRICPQCMKDRKRGKFEFLDMATGYITNGHSEMARLWLPARLNGEIWEVNHESKWQQLPESAIKGYFEYDFQIKLVLTVAQRLGWDIDTRANTWGEYRQTLREEYADKLAEKRKKRQEERRRQRYCERCKVYHTGRCPRRPRQVFGARAA